MNPLIVVGAQWGDEGKGKIVDYLSSKADIVVRFQGGNNAGHTVNVGNKEYRLNLIPSGVINPNITNIIGTGVVLDPVAFDLEVNKLKELGVKITPDNLIIADNCALILSIHKTLDDLVENARGKDKIGITRRGIGPAYEDKVGRRAIRISDLQGGEEYLKTKLKILINHYSPLITHHNAEPLNLDNLFKELESAKDIFLKFAKPIYNVAKKLKGKKKIVFEGAQGLMLDVEHGTYPYVTSSSTIASSAFNGSGFGYFSNSYVLGVAKAYATRVGQGPFPSEQEGELSEYLVQRGQEFGTVTNRKRRCGWFDAVLANQAIFTSGINGLVITKLDILDELDSIKICVAYEYNGERIDYMPSAGFTHNDLKPIYIELPGWKSTTISTEKFEDLPKNAQNYLSKIEELTQTEIVIVSTSPKREQTIIKKPFSWYS